MTENNKLKPFEFLQERVNYLEESNQRFMSILDMLASSSEFQGDLSRAKDAQGIYTATIGQLRRLFSFQSMGFLDSQSDGSFEMVVADPETIIKSLQTDVEARMLDGTFAWALNRNQAVLVPSDSGETLVLQVVATQSRVRGMFVGTLRGKSASMDAPALNALSIVLYSCAYALESTVLYGLLHDHTQHLEERVELRTRDLEVARQQAEAASLAKSDFLANMSHEIRTPMNGVMGMTDLLLLGGLTPEKEKKYLAAIKDSADTLMLIVNDILDFSKIEAGKFSLEKIPFNIRDALERCLSGLLVRAEQKGLKIIHNVNASVPKCLIGDPGRVRQVLTNLVGNAIKFCEKGEITVDVNLESIEMNDLTLQFSVTDTGIGIPEEACERIFNQFEQADSSTTRKFGGTGLGLAISKKLVELMDGSISVKSQLGVGSCFHFTVRLVLGNENMLIAEQKASAPSNQHNHSSMNILLADDVEINRALVQAILEPRGHNITCAENGKIAFEICQKNKFDIILMDVQMPEMDGLQASRAIRDYEKSAKLKPVPIVAMTAFAGAEDRQICIDAGMNDYLTKPVKAEKLLQMLNKFSQNPIEKAESTNDIIDSTTATKQEETTTVFEQDELLERLGGRIEMIPRFIALFCKGFTPELESLINSVDLGDADAVRRHSHAIKGSAANIAAVNINKIAADIEKSAKEGNLTDAAEKVYLLKKEFQKFIDVVTSLGFIAS